MSGVLEVRIEQECSLGRTLWEDGMLYPSAAVRFSHAYIATI
jgi:hypothetical protein